MEPQKQIRVGRWFMAVWIILGCAWLGDYVFGDADLKQLAFGELTILLGLASGFTMIRDARKKLQDK